MSQAKRITVDWIRVQSGRRIPRDVDLLIVTDDRAIHIDHYASYRNRWYYANCHNYRVTHWMPLPWPPAQPPRQGEAL